ncbi:MAG: amidase, partial [Candidatus Dormibacteraeota bacterium]|nr:amidase [Candidatus Dormibacteraeota bacterium]
MFPHPELADASVAELRARLDSGELSVPRLAEMHLERIAAMNQQGPALRAVLEVDPAWEATAAELEAELRRGETRGPLHGIPALIKDNIDTRTMLTTAGSWALAGSPAPADAPLVARMRAAGMLILGKANLSEWANFRSTRSMSGWSGRGRQCRNPHVLDRSPSGSSSGSAAAVAAGLTPLAVGTETDGSIIGPSTASGVVGLKPGVGVISQSGIIPISKSQDSAGPHARSVRDAALLLQVLADHPGDFTAHLDEGAARGRRIGVLRDPFAGYSLHADRLYEENLAALRDLGAELIDPVALETAGEMTQRWQEVEQVILDCEFKSGIEAYLSTRPQAGVRNLADLVRFNQEHAADEMPYFRQEIFERALEGPDIDSDEYRRALADSQRLSRVEGIDATLARHSLDVLVAPPRPPVSTIDLLNGERPTSPSTRPAAMAGYPIITVPAGWALDALPLGLIFFAGRGSEALLLGVCHA